MHSPEVINDAEGFASNLESQTPLNEDYEVGTDNLIHRSVLPFDAPKLLQNAVFSLNKLIKDWRGDQRFTTEIDDLSDSLDAGADNALIIHDAAQRMHRDLDTRIAEQSIPDDGDVQNIKITLLNAVADMGEADKTVKQALAARRKLNPARIQEADIETVADDMIEIIETQTEPKELRPLLLSNFEALRELAIQAKAHIDTETWLLTQTSYTFAARMVRVIRLALTKVADATKEMGEDALSKANQARKAANKFGSENKGSLVIVSAAAAVLSMLATILA